LKPVWNGTKSKACDSLERRKAYKDVSPDIEFANFQETAQKRLGSPTRTISASEQKSSSSPTGKSDTWSLKEVLSRGPIITVILRVTVTTFKGED